MIVQGIALAATSAVADVVSYSSSYSAPMTGFSSPIEQSVTLPRFYLAPLSDFQDVSLTYSFTMDLTFSVENQTANAGTIGGRLLIGLTGEAASHWLQPTLPDVLLGPSDGTPGSGPDYFQYHVVASTTFVDGHPPLSLPLFYGAGTIEPSLTFDGVIGQYSFGHVPVATLFTEGAIAGDISVNYTYVPAPTAMLLLVSVTARRRRR